MGDPWGIGGFKGRGGGGGGNPPCNIEQIVKKKTGEKILKSGEIGKNRIFFTENGLKCIRNPTKHL